MYQNQVNSETGSELLTVQDVKDYCRIDTASDDTLIGVLIVSARKQMENYISRDIVAKERSMFMDKTNGRISLTWGPIDSITTVTVGGTVTTDFETIGLNEKMIILDSGPALNVQVDYVTLGMSDDLLKQAMLQLVSTLYDNRADFVTGTIVASIDTTSKIILAGYRNVFI